jgi:hypothetical protein
MELFEKVPLQPSKTLLEKKAGRRGRRPLQDKLKFYPKGAVCGFALAKCTRQCASETANRRL